MSVTVLTLTWFLGGLFVIAAAMKLRHVQELALAIQAVASRRVAVPLAIAIIACEAACAAVLLTIDAGWPLLTAIGLLGLFTGYMAIALRSGRRIACRCFGDDDGPISAATIWRNLGFIACALTAWLLRWTDGSPLTALDYVLCGMSAATALAIFMAGWRFRSVGMPT